MSLSETAEIMEKIQAVLKLGKGSIQNSFKMFSFHFIDRYLLSIAVQINP